MLLRWIALISGEADDASRLINTDHSAYHPFSIGKLSPGACIPAVDMVEAIAFGCPEQAAVLQKAQIFMKVKPSLGSFFEEYPRRAARAVNLKHI